jgi:hemoglobin/transferrin/lactoferrin receptor protein
MKFNKQSVCVWRFRSLFACVSALAFLAAGAAHAQQPYWLDGITILATKTEERAIDSLAGISTLREEQLRAIAATRPNQLFVGMPGVSTEATAQDPGAAVNIRGLQDFGRVAVIVDGARQNFARAGHNGSGSFYLEPETLAEVDVSRGPVSNIYGSGAIGGVVSFRTKDADDILKPGETWGFATHGEIGSNKFSGLGSIFGAFRAGPNADFVFGGTYRQLDDYKDGSGNTIVNSGETVSTGLAKATFRPADGHEVKVGGIHYNADWVNGIENVTSVVRDSNAKNSTATASWGYSKPEDRLFDFRHSVYWNRVDVSTVVTWLAPPVFAGPPPPLIDYADFYGPVGNRAGYKVNTLGYDGHNTSRFDTGPFRHALTVGGDIFEDDVENFDNAGFGTGYNPSGNRRVWGSFAQLKTNYSTWLELITAARYDSYSLNGVDSVGTAVSTDGDRVSPKVTVGITPIEWLTFYGTYAEGYRAPAVTETMIAGIHPFPAFTFLPNPGLRPEVGKNKEFGVNIKRDDFLRPGDRWRVKANVFRNDVDDFIDTVTVPFAGPFGPCPNMTVFFCQQYQNVAKARIQGIELESIYDAGDWFAGLNAHRLRGKDLTEGDPLAKVPPDMVSATFGLRSADRKWTTALRWSHYAAKKRSDLPADNPSTPDDDELMNVTGSYNLVSLHLAYQPNENIVAALSVENLLNETYRVYTHEYNSPGITVKGSLRVRFAGGVPPLDEEKTKTR